MREERRERREERGERREEEGKILNIGRLKQLIPQGTSSTLTGFPTIL